MVKAVDELIAPLLCRHQNKQNVLPLICALPKGHEGDHSCEYPGGVAFWSDAAGEEK